MTPEQTLEWLAQQHFDQCCEERPIQDWIRKMKSQLPEQPKQNTVEAVKAVLKGIDQTEIESPDGWWETSAGAEFGAKKLKYVIGLLAQPEHSAPHGEPVAWMHPSGSVLRRLLTGIERENYTIPLYTTPPTQQSCSQRQCNVKPLTLGQKQRLWSSLGNKPTLKDRVNAFGLAIEAAHGIMSDTDGKGDA